LGHSIFHDSLDGFDLELSGVLVPLVRHGDTSRKGDYTLNLVSIESLEDHFLPSPTRIRVDPSDAQVFDVVGHEYGHAVMHWHGDYLGHVDDAGFDAITTPQTAWQQGFASFLPVALSDDGAFNFANSSVAMEPLLLQHENISSADALRTQGLVARALYDMYDNHGDTKYPWQIGRDHYWGGVSKIMEVLDRATVRTGFQTFWAGWRAWGPNPGQEPILAIRLNMIDLNTAPVWEQSSTFQAAPHTAVVLNTLDLVYDAQSLDSELIISLVSLSNGSVAYTWLSGRRLQLTLPTPTGEGSTTVVLRANDELATAIGSFNVVWSLNGKDDDPPDPCEYPCPTLRPPSAVLALQEPSPNPFRDTAAVRFALPGQQWASLAVYDVNGGRVRTLLGQTLDAGSHESAWDGRDDIGSKVPSGVYFVVLRTGGEHLVRKLVVLR
jgi:hypothetical protein